MIAAPVIIIIIIIRGEEQQAEQQGYEIGAVAAVAGGKRVPLLQFIFVLMMGCKRKGAGAGSIKVQTRLTLCCLVAS